MVYRQPSSCILIWFKESRGEMSFPKPVLRRTAISSWPPPLINYLPSKDQSSKHHPNGIKVSTFKFGEGPKYWLLTVLILGKSIQSFSINYVSYEFLQMPFIRFKASSFLSLFCQMFIYEQCPGLWENLFMYLLRWMCAVWILWMLWHWLLFCIQSCIPRISLLSYGIWPFLCVSIFNLPIICWRQWYTHL
jgi:hypothetical protein